MSVVGVGIESGYFGSYFKGKDKQIVFKPQGRAVIAKKKLEEVETRRQSIEVEYEDNVYKSLVIPRNELVSGSSSKWLGLGIDAYDYLMKVLLQTIQQQEEDLPYEYVHKGVGWIYFKDTRMYRSNEMIVPNNLKFNSNYVGGVDLGTKGNLEAWKEGMVKEVVGYTPLEFSLCIGVTAILIGYFKDVDDSLIINLYNDSSKGKTTACMVAASISYNPRFGENSLMTTWNNTENYLMGLLSDNYGMLTVLDEASLIKAKDISTMLYTLASGVEKGRMNALAELKDTRVWNTCILSTGESALEEMTNQNSGLKVRKLEYGDVVWTRDAEHSDRLKTIVSNNYGLAGTQIAKYLVDTDYFKVEQEYLEQVKMFLKQCKKKNELTHRIAKKQGLILYSAELLNRVLGIGINKDKLMTFLLNHNNEEQSEIEERAYEYIMGVVAKCESRFITRYVNGRRFKKHQMRNYELDIEYGSSKNLLGVIFIDECSQTRKIGFIPSELKAILTNGGFTSQKNILKRMKKRGWLDTEDKKLTRRKQVGTKSSLIPLNIIIDQAKLYEEEPLTNQEKEELDKEAKAQEEILKMTQEIINSED